MYKRLAQIPLKEMANQCWNVSRILLRNCVSHTLVLVFFRILFKCSFVILASACLVQIVDTLKNSYWRQIKIKNYSLLITPQTRVIDLACLSFNDESTATFQLMQLAAAKCPVHHITVLYFSNLFNLNICSCSNLHIFWECTCVHLKATKVSSLILKIFKYSMW